MSICRFIPARVVKTCVRKTPKMVGVSRDWCLAKPFRNVNLLENGIVVVIELGRVSLIVSFFLPDE